MITRHKLLRLALPALALLPGLPTGLAARPALDNKPNLIVVFLDDAGCGDFSHTGNPTIHTPAISRLVREGVACLLLPVPGGGGRGGNGSWGTARGLHRQPWQRGGQRDGHGMLSVARGHWRYAQIKAVRGDRVNPAWGCPCFLFVFARVPRA